MTLTDSLVSVFYWYFLIVMRDLDTDGFLLIERGRQSSALSRGED